MQKRSSKSKIKRDQFNLHWNINEKEQQYNALQDPHTNYYFVSKAAKQRLKDLKSQMKRQHKNSPKTKEAIRQINSKIRFQFPKIKLPLLQNSHTEGKELQKEQRKLSEQFLMKIVTQRGDYRNQKSNLRLIQNKKSYQYLENPSELKKQNTVKHRKSKNKLKSMKRQSQKTQVNHNQFLQFLQRKKLEIKLAQSQKIMK